MSETVGTAIVELEVRDAEALAELAAFEAALAGLDKELHGLDDKKVKVDLDIKDFRQKQRELRSKIKELDAAERKLGAAFTSSDKAARTRAKNQLAAVEQEIVAAQRKQTEINKEITLLKQREKTEKSNHSAALARSRDTRAALDAERTAEKRRGAERDKQFQQGMEEIHAMALAEDRLWGERQKAHRAWLREREEQGRVSKRLRDQEIRDADRVAASIANAARRQIVDEYRLGKVRAEQHSAWAAASHETERLLRSKREAAARDLEMERRNAPIIEAGYQKMGLALQKLARERLKLTSQKQVNQGAVLNVDLKVADIDRRMAEVRNRFRTINGRDPILLNVTPHISERMGNKLRQDISARLGGNQNASLFAKAFAGTAVGGIIARDITIGIANDLKKVRPSTFAAAGGSIARTLGGFFKDKAASLAEMTVRIGPFTASIRKALLGLTLLGPTIVAAVGALGSLVGSVGSAALGVGVLGTAILGGAIPAFAGLFTVVKPVVTQLKSAMAASKAYNDAVAKHGKGSDQAAKKLKEFNSVLGHTDKATREAYLSTGKMRDRWESLTKPAKQQAMQTIGAGIAFANKHMRVFSSLTNEGTKNLGQGLRGIMQRFDFSAFSKMGRGFNAAIKPALAGFGSLLNYVTRVGAAASRHLAPLANTFKNWAAGVEGTTNNFTQFNNKIDRTVNSVKTLGRFLMSSGRLLKAFFGAGVDSGNEFTQTMTDAMDRWTAFLKTTEGKDKTKNFFQGSVEGLQALYSLLAPVVSTFTTWAIVLEPVIRAATVFSGALASLAANVLKVTVLRGAVQAFVATLAGLYAVKKADAAIAGLLRFSDAIRGIKREEQALAASRAVTGGAGGLGSVGGVPVGKTLFGKAAPKAVPEVAPVITKTVQKDGAVLLERQAVAAGEAAAATGVLASQSTKAKGELGLLRGAASLVIPSIASMGIVAGSAATLGLGAVAAAAVYGGYKLLTMKSATDKLNDRFKESRGAARSAGQEFVQLRTESTGASIAFQQSALSVQQQRKELSKLKKGSIEYKQGLLNLRSSEQQLAADRSTWIKTREGMERTANDRFTQRSAAYMTALETQSKMEKKLADDRAAHAKSGSKLKFEDTAVGKEDIANLRNYTEALTRAQAAQREAINAQAAVPGNIARAWKGLSPLVGEAEQRLGRLANMAGGKFANIAKSIAVKYEAPQDASKVLASATKALDKGVSKSVVMKIIANTKSVDTAIARIQAARNLVEGNPSTFKIISKGGPEAVKWLERIIGKKLTTKQQQIAQKGGPELLALLRRILNIKPGTKTVPIKAKDDATPVINGLSGDRVIGHRWIDVQVRKLRGGADGGFVGMAAGGPTMHGKGRTGATQPNERQIARAATTAKVAGVRETKGGIYKTPTLLVGEENRSEAVISFNPAYRKRNQEYLKTAAWALGMKQPEPAAAGRNAAGLPASIKKLPVPDPYRAGAVDPTDAEHDRDAWKTAYTTRRDALDRVNNSIDDKKSKEPKGKGAKKKNKAGNSPYSTWKKSYDILLKKKDRIIHGDPDAQDPMGKLSKSLIKARWQDTDKQVTRLTKANAAIDLLSTQAETERTRMANAARIYNDPRMTAAARKNAKIEYDKALGARRDDLGKLYEKTRMRRDVAKMLLDLSPRSDKLRDFWAKADGETESAKGQWDEADATKPSDDLTGPQQTVEDYAGLKGLGQELTQATLASKEAATTINDSTDDEAARLRLFNVFTSLVSSAKAEGMAQSNPDLLGQLYDSLAGVSQATGNTAQEDAVAAQKAAREAAITRGDLVDSAVLSAFRGNGNMGNNPLLQEYFGSPTVGAANRSKNPATLAEAGAAGPIARTADQGSGGNNTTVNINALTANPKDALQAANTIVGGIGYQGGRQATSTKVGA